LNESAATTGPIESRHLRLLLAIVDEGGVTRAARRVHLSQSALSHQLRQIESSLGVPLFLRVNRRLVLTDAGRQIVQRARPIVAELDDLRQDVHQHAAGARGTLRIATECYTCYEWLPPLLKRFHRRFPGIEVGIVAGATRDPMSALRDGQIDLGIVTRTSEDSSVEQRELFQDELLLITPVEHRLASRPFVRAADLETERMLLYTPIEENFFYQDFFAKRGRRPGAVDVIQLTEAILSMVRAGLGLTVAAAWAVGPEITAGRVAGVRLGSKGFRRRWLAALRRPRRGAQPDYMLEFLRLLASEVAPARFAHAPRERRGTHGGRSARAS
jgi:LysR family transcriptional regulator, regulator for metE and metH